jgi:hypothetical protein
MKVIASGSWGGPAAGFSVVVFKEKKSLGKDVLVACYRLIAESKLLYQPDFSELVDSMHQRVNNISALFDKSRKLRAQHKQWSLNPLALE